GGAAFWMARSIDLNLYRRRPATFAACGVIPRSTFRGRRCSLLLKRYGERALDESAARADELALAGDDDGAAAWRRIMAAVIPARQQNPARPGPMTDAFHVVIGCIAPSGRDCRPLMDFVPEAGVHGSPARDN